MSQVSPSEHSSQPSIQFKQLPDPSSEYWFEWQLIQLDDPAEEYVPSAQIVQIFPASRKYPAEQELQVVPSEHESQPAIQFEQVPDPSVEYCLLPQGVQLVDPAAAEVPAGHMEQVLNSSL